MDLLIYLAQRTINYVSTSMWSFYLYDVYLTTVRYEMPKRQLHAVVIRSGKTIARLTELKIAYCLLLTIVFLAHGKEYAFSFINR
jgi:Xaa-Pro aminopeptidase